MDNKPFRPIIEKDLLERIDKFRFKHEIAGTRVAAIRRLIEDGLKYNAKAKEKT